MTDTNEKQVAEAPKEVPATESEFQKQIDELKAAIEKHTALLHEHGIR